MTAPQLSISIRPAAEVADIAALWRDLETRADASFFLSWDWIGCWLRESGAAPFLLAAREGERIVAMALLQPARHRRHHLLNTRALMLHQLGDHDIDIITIEHNGLLVDRAFTAIAMPACIDFLMRHRDPSMGWDWDELHIGGVADPERLRPLADRAGLMMWYHAYKQSWAVDLDAIRNTTSTGAPTGTGPAGAGYLDTLSSNTRYQIRRATRLYEKRGPLTATPAREIGEAMRYFDHMKELHQRYWVGRGHPGSFAYPFFERFHRALIAECLPKGTVELVCIAAGGVPIGYVYNFVYNGWVCAYHTGFEYEDDPKFKPGLVSHQLCIERHLRDGARLYDFLAGGERYKANLAQPGPDIAYLVLQRPLLKLRVETAARWLKSAGLKRLVSDVRAAPEPAEARARAGKVLVLGDDTRSFLAIVRSLGRQGIEVHAAPANFASPALRSRHIARIQYLPFWMGDGSEWLQAMETLLRAERYDLVIPCNETTLLPIRQNRARLQRLARLAIPDDHSIDVLFDKHETRELARSLGIPVSPGRLPRPDDTAEAVLAELGTPVVVKPRKSYSVEELQARGKVQILDTAEQLRPLLPHLDPAQFLYEGFFPGAGAGVSVLASQGRVLQAFEHHRVRESGSGSYYRISAPLTPALEKCCADMVAALGYTGVAMFEFRLDETKGSDGGWVLLEVNARPWGSMPLPVGLGVDFPYRWYALLVEGRETPPVPYRTGVFGRNLLPDLRATLSEAKALGGGPAGLARFGLGRLAEFRRMLGGRELQDVLVRDDPAPGWREIGEVLRDIRARLGQKISKGKSVPARQQLVQALAQRTGGGQGVRLLFVCQGNICRSPFAAALLRARLSPRLQVSVASFGMLPRPGRPTPEFGIQAAADQGIDLTPHRSAHLSRAEAEGATAILVFDAINRRAILERYPELRTPILRLGDFAPAATAPVGDIEDPIDGPPAVYAATYAAIERSVLGLVEALAAALPELPTPEYPHAPPSGADAPAVPAVPVSEGR